MRILHCAGFNEQKLGNAFYSTDRKISNGLIRNGHSVYDFSYRYYAKQHTPFFLKGLRSKTAESALFKIARNYQPDVLLLGKSENITHYVLKKIKEILPNIKIGMWWVDPIYILGDIEKKLELVDAFFLTTDPCELSRVFNNDWLEKKSHFLPNLCDSSIDVYKGFENVSYKHDILFIGRPDPNRKHLSDYLEKLSKRFNVGIYGQNENLLLGNEYLKTIANSKIALNFSRYNNLSMYSSDRMVHLAANGCLVLSSYVPNIENIFTSKEVVYFDDFNDMESKVLFYLENENIRKDIAKKGWERAHNDYDSTEITRSILKSLDASA